MTERQFTVKEFCRRYGVGPTTAYKLIGQGALTAVRYGRRTLIDAESAETWRKSLPRLAHHLAHHQGADDGEQERNAAKPSAPARH